jgi:hypothetical protein
MIHDLIMERVQERLQHVLIDQILATDPSRAGVVKQGDLQGEPDPDVARISITIHENDPDMFISGAVTQATSHWMDVVEFAEVGGAITMRRRFTVKGRVLLDTTGEGLAASRRIASIVRSRIETALLNTSFDGVVADDGEYVAMGASNESVFGETRQGGGPPDSYDFLIKVRFDVLTTKINR